MSVKTPRTAEVLRKNPLGLYVEAIDWSREYEAAEPVRPTEAASAVREPATGAVPLPPALPISTETEGKLP